MIKINCTASTEKKAVKEKYHLTAKVTYLSHSFLFFFYLVRELLCKTIPHLLPKCTFSPKHFLPSQNDQKNQTRLHQCQRIIFQSKTNP